MTPIVLAQSQAPVTTLQVAQASPILYIDPSSGTDSPGAGQSATPLRTISFALQRSQAGTMIQLAPGTYSVESGESFPLTLPSGVILKGDTSTKGANIFIKGGGEMLSPSFARQQAGIVAQGNSQILGITVTNPITRGTGVWIEDGNPIIADSTFTGNHRDGVFATGSSAPKITNNIFTKNGGNGISWARNAQGEIRGNSFVETGFGLAIGGSSNVLITDNQISQNMDGIIVSDRARPTIRQNQIQGNTRDGLVIIGNAMPDLGSNGTAGNNVIEQNKRFDLNNSSKTHTVVVAGNTLNPKKVFGNVSFETASQTPITQAPISQKPGTPTPASTKKPGTPTPTSTKKPGTPTPTSTKKPGTPTPTPTATKKSGTSTSTKKPGTTAPSSTPTTTKKSGTPTPTATPAATKKLGTPTPTATPTATPTLGTPTPTATPAATPKP